MRKPQLISSVMLALAVGAVWFTASASSAPAPQAAPVQERSSQCGVRPPYAADFSASVTPEEARSSVRGPMTLQEDGAPQGAALGYCIDCTRCSSGKDCRHTGYTFCYAQCP